MQTNRMITRALATVAIVGTTSSLALAQYDSQNSQRERQNQADRNQNERANPNNNRDASDQHHDGWSGEKGESWFDEYFGSASSQDADLRELDDLAGLWKITTTVYDTSSENGGVKMTSTGYAERRWTLGGTVLSEVYTLDGSPRDLPLRSGVFGSGADAHGEHDADRDNTPRDGAQRDRGNSSRRDAMEPDNTRDRTPGASRQGSTSSHSSASAHAMSDHGKGLVLWGYDRTKDRFNVVWTDADTSAIRFDTGKLDHNTLTLTGEYTDPRDNETYSTRTVIRMTSPVQQTVTMYRDGGIFDAETKVYEIVYTKADATALSDDAMSPRRGTRAGVDTDRP